MNKKIQLKNTPKADYVSISRDFRADFLNIKKHPALLEQPTLVTKLIFHIVSDLRDYVYFTSHFQGVSNQMKMDLWNSEFVGDDRTEISRTYNISSFLKNRNKEAIKESLEFLKNFKNETYSFYNTKGKKITTSGGLLTNWFFAENSGNFEIIISQYWANKIVAIDTSNKFFLHLLDVFKNNKQLFFYLWLLEFKEVTTPDGIKLKMTTVKFETLQDAYNLKYKNAYDLMRFWLLPMKTKIESCKLGVSFRCNINAENSNKIDIIAFEQKPNEVIDNGEVSGNMVTYKLSYFTRLYGLREENKAFIKDLLEKDYFVFIDKYKQFIKNCSAEKIYAKNYKDNAFCEKIAALYNE